MPNYEDAILPTPPPRFRTAIGLLTLFWTLAVVVVLAWEGHDERKHSDEMIRSLAPDSQSKREAIWLMQSINIRDRLLGYGGMWLLGLGGISLFSRHLARQIQRRLNAEQKLRDANDRLEQRVAERTAELAAANGRLQDEVAERRKAEQWLLESEERFRGYFEQGLVGMAMLSAEMQWLEINERFCRMLGYSEDELFLVDWNAIIHSDDLSNEQSQFNRILEGLARGFVLDLRLVRKGGEIFHVGLSAQCMRKADGSVDCILILVQETPRHG